MGGEPAERRSKALTRSSTPATIAPTRAPELQPTSAIRSSSTCGSDCSTSTARLAATTVATAALRWAASFCDAVPVAGAESFGMVIVIVTTPRAAIHVAGTSSSVRSPPVPCR